MAKKPKAEPAEVIEKDLETVLEAESEADAQQIVDGMAEAAAEFVPEGTKPKIDYGSPEQLAIYDAETQAQVKAIADEVGEAEREEDELKDEHAAAKKTREKLEVKLRTFINERSEQRGKPPKPVTGDLFAGAKEGTLPDVWPPADLWERFPLDRFEEFGLTRGDIDKFAAGEMKGGKEGIGPIETMGAVSRFTAPTATGWARKLTDLKGIGQATLDRWSEAETKFWAAWNGGLGEKFAEEQGLTRPEPEDADDEAEAVEGEDAANEGAEDRQAA